jgi:SsrA-binding protein
MEIIASNRKARFNFQILDKYETGIVLSGTEIKSLRANRVSINEAYVIEKNDELILINTHIPEYEPAHQFNHKPARSRKLLSQKA